MKNRHLEKLCRRCGECCRLKREIEGGVFVIDGERYCPHLKWNGVAYCEIYGQNYHRVIPVGTERTMCLSADEMARAGLLPEDCPYAKEIPNYHCRVIGYEERRNHDRH